MHQYKWTFTASLKYSFLLILIDFSCLAGDAHTILRENPSEEDDDENDDDDDDDDYE